MSLPIVIQDRTEGRRGCGYRKPGGKYLVKHDAFGMPCGMLPIPLTVCPCCSAGIKPARGWTWVNVPMLTKDRECLADRRCADCSFQNIGRAGLLWIGEKFYPTPGDFTAESAQKGISRRLSQIPKDFVIGKTWVLVAHRKTIEEPCPACNANGKPFVLSDCETCEGKGKIMTPGVFHAFKPTAIEYVLAGTESEEQLRDLMKRGFTLVRVKRDDGKPLGSTDEDDE